MRNKEILRIVNSKISSLGDDIKKSLKEDGRSSSAVNYRRDLRTAQDTLRNLIVFDFGLWKKE